MIDWKSKTLSHNQGHIYEAQTDHGRFQLWHRRATRRGRTFKYRVWVLHVDGVPVAGGQRYRLMDAKAHAEDHLAALIEKAERRAARLAR